MTNLDEVSLSPHTSSLAPIRLPSTGQDLARLFEISPDALIVINQAGIIIRVNTQIEALFGYAQEEMTGKPLELLLPHGSVAPMPSIETTILPTHALARWEPGSHSSGCTKMELSSPLILVCDPSFLMITRMSLGPYAI